MDKNIKISTEEKLECKIAHFFNANFKLDSGYQLDDFNIAYKTYGKVIQKPFKNDQKLLQNPFPKAC